MGVDDREQRQESGDEAAGCDRVREREEVADVVTLQPGTGLAG